MKKNREKHLKMYRFYRFILGCIFKVYYRPKLIDKDNIPKDGPVIICGNHMHLFDQNLAIISTKRMIHYMAKKEYFDNWKTKWFFKSAGCISVDRENHDNEAKDEAYSLLENGYVVGIFPEGTRNKTDEFLLPFKFGAVSLAQKTNAYIVPFAVTGKYKFFKNHLNVRFGIPFKVNKNMSLEEANKLLYDKVYKLKEAGIKDIKNNIV